ncbi:MAG: hypothetical protein MK180_10620 [Rhodobacteraceae bacterium]|nr:hypothetical protein [Paracoccaceae bacterium]
MLAFLLAIGAGFASRIVQEPLVGALEKVLIDKIDIRTEEALALSYALSLFLLTLVLLLIGYGDPGAAILLGGLIGLFATQIIGAIRKAIS